MQTVGETDFHFPGQSAVYHGKVRDVYVVGDQFISVATDRISAFDVILPRQIPCKGQVLNQLAAHFLEATRDIVPNWLRAVPDPNASVGQKADPIKIEMVVRGMLVGHAWREYRDGKRELCGVPLEEGMHEYDTFPSPIITPSTKADEGHDEDISADEILQQGLATAEQWQQLTDYSLKLFMRGQEMANERGLILADTKYEFGIVDGQIILIDEVHTPDSSRYFYKNGYEAFMADRNQSKPAHLSKEFVREWLMERGFSGQAGESLPDMDDKFVQKVSARYIELYEKLTGERFVKADVADPAQRIQTNITNYLEKN